MQIFAIYDKKAQYHEKPFFCRNKAEALRAVESGVNSSDSFMHKYPADFSVWLLGEFDEKTGTIEGLEKPEFLEECQSLVKKGA